MVKKRLLSITVLLLVSAWTLFVPASLHAIDTQMLDIAIMSVEKAGPPVSVGDVLLFSYQPASGHVRYVGARFAHESYVVLHPYVRNESGIFVLGYRVPEGVEEIRYRIVVDGLWMNDPASPAERDFLGNPISLYRIEKEIPRSIVNPTIEPDGGVRFVFQGKPGQRISISGDFNNWEPFIDFLSEIPDKPGFFSIRLRIKSGAHYYFFFSEGMRIMDPKNPEKAADPSGNEVSYFFLPT
jgi:hypothetical protein